MLPAFAFRVFLNRTRPAQPACAASGRFPAYPVLFAIGHGPSFHAFRENAPEPAAWQTNDYEDTANNLENLNG